MSTNIRNRPSIRIEKISPAKAEQYLAMSVTGNRKPRKNLVRRLVDQIQRGQWQVTSETIKFDTAGKMFDGQHRLMAIIESGWTVEAAVGRNIDPTAFSVVDSGMSRQAADHLQALAIPSAALTASVSKLILGLDRGFNPTNTADMSLISRTDIYDFVSANEAEVQYAVNTGRNLDAAIGGNQSAWSAFIFLARRAGYTDELTSFLAAVETGANLKPGNPALALRNWVARLRGRDGIARITNLGTYLKTFIQYLNESELMIVRRWDNSQQWPVLANKD